MRSERPHRSHHLLSPTTFLPLLAGLTVAACAGGESPGVEPPGSGGTTSTGSGGQASGGTTPTGSGGSGGSHGSGGVTSSGGTSSSGGASASGGITGSSGGATASGGATSTGGQSGATAGGRSGQAGRTGGGSGGSAGRTGTAGMPGMASSGGATGAAGSSGGMINCNGTLTGGTQHCSSNSSGKNGNYTWTIWSSGGGGCLTTYGTTDATFSATWNNSGDFLARVGLQWDRTKTYDQLGTISGDFAQTKSGSGGGYSYVGIYGWSVQPTIEFYIVEDSYNRMPVNPGGTKTGSAMIDGDTYDFYSHPTSGASIDGSGSFTQFFSVRHTARKCGHISLSEHFAAWSKANMKLGKMVEAKYLVEAGGGSGSASFTTATLTAE